MSYDLLDYLRGAIAPGQTAGRPVGVTQTPGGDAIYQIQLDAPNSRRFFQVKGSFGAPCDWEELHYDDQFVYRAIDISRKASEGGPYTLYDTPGQRGSKWAKRFMAVGEVFERNPFVAAFDMQTGRHTKVDGPVRTWLKLAAVHAEWRGLKNVLELWWLTASPTQAAPTERYFYGPGLVGFEGSGMTAYPNHAWPALPPAPGVPVLQRKPVGFPLPALPTTVAPDPADFWLLNPCDFAHVITDRFNAQRSYGKHEGIDFAPRAGASTPHVRASQSGTVESVGYSASGYGNYVRVRHEWRGETWKTWYGHLERATVKQGDSVAVGQRIGVAGSTGNSTGVHVHLTLQRVGKGLKGYVVDDVVDPEPCLRAGVPIPEPPISDDDTQKLPPVPPSIDRIRATLAHMKALSSQLQNDITTIERYLEELS